MRWKRFVSGHGEGLLSDMIDIVHSVNCVFEIRP